MDFKQLLNEVTFNFTRSSGKGGQNVNKVETKAELLFNINQSKILTDDQKALLVKNLSHKLDKENNLRVSSSVERYQHANRKKAEEKFLALIQKALKPIKKRYKTSATGASKIARLASKKMHSNKKKLRQKAMLE